MIHLHMPIFADHPYTRADSARGVEHWSASVIQFAGETGHIAARGAEALRIVIQVRQIDKRQIGPFALQYLGSAARDPLRAGQSRHRTPERGKGKRTEFAFEIVRQSRRRAGDAEDLVAVGPVIRFGRDADIDGGALVEPPEQLGTAKRFPGLRRAPPSGDVQRCRLDQAIGLLPEADLAGIAPQPAVGDDAVSLRRLSGQQRRLRRTGDSG